MGTRIGRIRKVLGSSHLDAFAKAKYLFDALTFQHRTAGMAKENRTWLFGFEIAFSNPASLKHLLRETFLDASYFVPFVTSSPVIFDVGSNIGITTLFFKKIYSNAAVYSFEPDPDTFAILKTNIERNSLHGVSAFNVGLSDFEGKAVLHVPPWSNGSSSLFPEKVEIEAQYAGQRFGSSDFSMIEKEVRVTRCSDFIGRNGIGHIDLLKIDAEGAEETIIGDITGLLSMIDVIIFEYHYTRRFVMRNSLARIISVLENADFIVSVNPDWFTREPDVMCTYMVKAVNGRCRESSALLQACKG